MILSQSARPLGRGEHDTRSSDGVASLRIDGMENEKEEIAHGGCQCSPACWRRGRALPPPIMCGVWCSTLNRIHICRQSVLSHSAIPDSPCPTLPIFSFPLHPLCPIHTPYHLIPLHPTIPHSSFLSLLPLFHLLQPPPCSKPSASVAVLAHQNIGGLPSRTTLRARLPSRAMLRTLPAQHV